LYREIDAASSLMRGRAAPAAELLAGQHFAGYRVEGTAGRGGMGIVYRATQLAGGRTVALKLLDPALAADESFRARFEHEARLLASIEHPHVVAVDEAGVAEGQPFIAMPFVDGVALHELVAVEGPLDAERAARIVAQIGDGLDATHARGLVHRDVKPANVLLEWRSASEHAYLCDFGLSKSAAATHSMTQTGRWVGTLDYVAPEQIEGRPVDARTDVYALGGVLFHALTGRAPYSGAGDAEKLWAHLHGSIPSACALRPGLPGALDAVLARALAKDPAARYASAGALGRAALAAAGGEQPTDVDLGRPAARGAGPVMLAALTALVVVAGALTTLLFGDHDGYRVDDVDLGARTPTMVVADARRAVALAEGPLDEAEIVSVGTRGAVAAREVRSLGSAATPTRIALDGFDRERVWILYREAGAVVALDAHGGPGSRPALQVDDPVAVAALPRDVLVVLSGGPRSRLQRFDARSLRPLGRPVATGHEAVDVRYLPRGELVMTVAGPPLRIVTYGTDLRRRGSVAVHRDAGLPTLSETGVTDVALDARRRVVWLLVPFDASALGTTPQLIVRVDLVAGRVVGAPIAVASSVRNIAVVGDAVWVTNVAAGRIERFDVRSGRRSGPAIEVGPIDSGLAAAAGAAWIVGMRGLVRVSPECRSTYLRLGSCS